MSDMRKLADWIVETCLLFGATIPTAYQVAGLFIEAIQAKPPADGGSR